MIEIQLNIKYFLKKDNPLSSHPPNIFRISNIPFTKLLLFLFQHSWLIIYSQSTSEKRHLQLPKHFFSQFSKIKGYLKSIVKSNYLNSKTPDVTMAIAKPSLSTNLFPL